MKGGKFLMEKICGIYCIENLINGKRYVGQSVDILKRFRSHKNKLNAHKHANGYLQNAWDKYGEENFKFYILEETTIETLDDRERYYIKEWNLQNRGCGYNLDSGGNEKKELSEETRNKIRELHKKENLSQETLTKMRESARKRCSDPEWRQAQSDRLKGRKLSIKIREKMSASRTGQKRSNEFKLRQRNAQIVSSVICIETGEMFICAKDAAIAKDIGPTMGGTILQCCRGKRKTCGGYHWKFANENIESNTSNESISNINVCNR